VSGGLTRVRKGNDSPFPFGTSTQGANGNRGGQNKEIHNAHNTKRFIFTPGNKTYNLLRTSLQADQE